MGFRRIAAKDGQKKRPAGLIILRAFSDLVSLVYLGSLFQVAHRSLFTNKVRSPDFATAGVIAIVGVAGYRVTQEDSLILFLWVNQVGLKNVTDP